MFSSQKEKKRRTNKKNYLASKYSAPPSLKHNDNPNQGNGNYIPFTS